MGKVNTNTYGDATLGEKTVNRVTGRVIEAALKRGQVKVDTSDTDSTLHTHLGSGRNAGSQRGVSDGTAHHPSLGGGQKK